MCEGALHWPFVFVLFFFFFPLPLPPLPILLPPFPPLALRQICSTRIESSLHDACDDRRRPFLFISFFFLIGVVFFFCGFGWEDGVVVSCRVWLLYSRMEVPNGKGRPEAEQEEEEEAQVGVVVLVMGHSSALLCPFPSPFPPIPRSG